MSEQQLYIGSPIKTRMRKPDPEGSSKRDRALLMVVEKHVLPRMVLRSPGLKRPERFGDGLSEEVRGMTDRALASDAGGSRSVLQRLHRAGATFNDLQLGLLAPAARRLNDLWAQDSVSFLDVTLAAGNLQQMMRFVALDLAAPRLAAPIGRTILVAPTPGQQHVLGASMAAEFFRREGWNVVFEPRPTEASLVARVSDDWIDVLGLSVADGRDIMTLRWMIAAMRAASKNAHLLVIIGGEAVTETPEILSQIGADAALAAVERAPARAHRLTDALFGGKRRAG